MTPIEWARQALAENPSPLTNEERANLLRWWGDVEPAEETPVLAQPA